MKTTEKTNADSTLYIDADGVATLPPRPAEAYNPVTGKGTLEYPVPPATDEEDEEEITDEDREILEAYRDAQDPDGTLEEALDNYAGEITSLKWDDDARKAEFLMEFTELSEFPREVLERYFDWESFAHDEFIETYYTLDGKHVFKRY